MTHVLIRRDQLGNQRGNGKEGHAKIEAEIGVVQLRAKEHEGECATSRSSEEAQRILLSKSPQKVTALLAPEFGLLDFTTMRELISVVWNPPSLWYFVTAALGN